MQQSVNERLMIYRPLSQFLRWYMAPEILMRLDDGRVKPGELLSVSSVRFLLSAPPVVQINEEVNLLGSVRAKRAVAQGEVLTLADVDEADCHVLPPEVGGKRVAYVYALSLYLDFISFFDFSPNAPDGPIDWPMSFPIGPVVRAIHLSHEIRPIEQFKLIAQHDWPPGRGYYPDMLRSVAAGTLSPASPAFADVIAASHTREYWEVELAFWDAVKLFPTRLPYVRKAIDEYLAGDYISCVRVIAPEFEGIIREYLDTCEIKTSRAGFLRQFRERILGHGYVMFSEQLLDLILGFIERDLMADTTTVEDPGRQINRHGVAHGIFAGFESRDISLKYLILLDSLAFVVFHDRLVDGTL